MSMLQMSESPKRFEPSPRLLPLWSVIAAFGTYFCMYAFRKPFTSASFSDLQYGGIGFKTILVTSQVFGYMVAKFIGIKVISEMRPENRATGILKMIISAELALILFALVPPPINTVFLFLNGLSLGMVFGLVLGYLEGRRQTEALAAGLCASFILADGITKSVGGYVMKAGIGEMQMPAVSGFFFLMPTVLFVWMLSRIPLPNQRDQEARNHRGQMNHSDRSHFFRKYAIGLVPLMLCYLFVTILRSIRADFAPELWKDLGVTQQPAIFTQSEFYVTLLVMLASGLSIFIKSNRTAFLVSIGISILGSVLIVLSVFGWTNGFFSGFPMMVGLGLGLYLPYVAIHTTVFERFLALTRDRGNVGYLMYLADSFGYLGYVGIMIWKNYVGAKGNMADFYFNLCLYLGFGSILMLGITFLAFRNIKPVTSNEVA
ncbi:MAG: hypothetical protein RJA81_929 [Planctomycetota bacterium]|jgi:hypothetical protein